MNRILPVALAAALLASPFTSAHAADTAPREPYGIALEGFAYPYPVHLLPVINDGEQLSMAYMDVAPGAAEWPHNRAAARAQFSVELLGARHQDAQRGRFSRRGAGPDRLRQILQAARRAALRHAGAQHHRAARSSQDRQGRDRRAFARRHAGRAHRPRLSGARRPSRADRADRAGRLPPLRAADADREDHRDRGQAHTPTAIASSSRPITRSSCRRTRSRRSSMPASTSRAARTISAGCAPTSAPAR